MKSLTNVELTYMIRALMSNSLPYYVNPWLLYRHHETVSGQIALSRMPNLRDSQNRQDGNAHVQLTVEKRDDGQTVLFGKATAELELDCQRCLKPLIKTFEATFELVLVKYEQQLSSVSDEDDALVVLEQLELNPLIEQELILALPMIAKHDNCQAIYENTANGVIERQQPFANLKDLLG